MDSNYDEFMAGDCEGPRESLVGFLKNGLLFRICKKYGHEPKKVGTVGTLEVWKCSRCEQLVPAPKP